MYRIEGTCHVRTRSEKRQKYLKFCGLCRLSLCWDDYPEPWSVIIFGSRKRSHRCVPASFLGRLNIQRLLLHTFLNYRIPFGLIKNHAALFLDKTQRRCLSPFLLKYLYHLEQKTYQLKFSVKLSTSCIKLQWNDLQPQLGLDGSSLGLAERQIWGYNNFFNRFYKPSIAKDVLQTVW